MLAALTVALLTPTADRPNIVLFLVDDLGWADVGFDNPDTFYETPNLDRLATRSTVFTSGYASCPVCSPTRFAVMTGRYASRRDATEWFTGRRSGHFEPAPLNNRMPLDEVTVAERLRDAGYHTAFLGKWHLGPDETFFPTAQGFDLNFGGCHKGHPPSYFAPYRIATLDDGPDGEFLTRRLADEAIGLIEQSAGDDRPFFVDLSFYTVHTPLQAEDETVAKYRRKAEALGYESLGRDATKPFDDSQFATEEQVLPPDRGGSDPRRVRTAQAHPTYAAMVESMDTAVGRVLDALDAAGVRDETLILFTSDNGGLSTAEGWPTSNLPLRGGKGWTYEGGIRVPFLIAMPGQSEGRVCHEPVCSIDLLPTVCAAAGVAIDGDPADPERAIDGVDLTPLLNGESIDERDLYWHYPHYANQGGFPSGAVRRGDWKLIERYEDGRVHLYNLADDLGEQTDLANAEPGRVADMRGRLHDWYLRVDAKFLRPRDGRQPWRP